MQRIGSTGDRSGSPPAGHNDITGQAALDLQPDIGLSAPALPDLLGLCPIAADPASLGDKFRWRTTRGPSELTSSGPFERVLLPLPAAQQERIVPRWKSQTGHKRTTVDTKNPALGGASWFLCCIQTFFLRRAAAMPTRPRPNRARVPGSGTLTRLLS